MISRLILLGWLFVTALISFSCSEQNKEPKEIVSEESSPAEELTERISKDPQNAALYYQRAKWYVSVKKGMLAEADIRKAISLDSLQADYFMLLADITFAGMHIPEAEDALKKAVVLDNTKIDAHLKLAELYLYLKRYEESIDQANVALKIDKRKGKAYFIKGFVYKETRDTLRAISSFQTCLEQEPAYYDAMIQLGNIYAVHNDPLALQYYNNALKLQPHSVEALYDRGLYFQNIGKFDKAVEDYNALLKTDPTYGFAYFNLGYIAMAHEKDYRKAIPLFTSALNHEKHYVEAYYNRGVCYENIGEKEKAKADYMEALNIFPTYDLAKKALKNL